MWESGIVRLIRGGITGVLTLLVGAIAGLAVVLGGTKSVVIVPGIVFVTAFVLMPFSGLYAIVATTPVNVEIAGPITVSRLAILLGALAIFVQAAKRQIMVPRIAIWPEGTLVTVFFAWVAIATFGAGGGGYFGKLGPWIIFAIIYFVVLNYAADIRQMRRLFLLIAVVGALQALLVLAEALFGFSPFGGWHEELAKDQADGEVRVVGTSAHPIILAGFFQVVLGVLVTLVFTVKNNFMRLIWIGAIGLVVMGWWLTFARSSWIGMAAMIFVAMLMASVITRRLAVIGATVGLAVLTAFNFNPDEVIQFIESFKSISSASSLSGVAAGSESLSWRTENWAAAWQIFLQNPVFGTGIDASKERMLVNMPLGAIAHQFIAPEVPHNMFLLILAELGAVTFVLFIAIWIMSFRSLVTAMQVAAYRPFAIGMAAIMVGQLATFFFNPIPREVWLTMGMAMALGRGAKFYQARGHGVPETRPLAA